MSESATEFIAANGASGEPFSMTEFGPFKKGDPLIIALGTAVSLWILELKRLSHEERMDYLRGCGDQVAEYSDSILAVGNRKHVGQRRIKKHCAETFNALARGIAVLAYEPGGVTAFGMHWETEEAER